VSIPSAAADANPPEPPAGDAASRHHARYADIDASPEFIALRSRYRRFVFPVTGGALTFYFTYVLCAAYAPGFMSETVSGNVNVGMVFGFLQFVMVFGITTIYVRFARRSLDPAAERIRAQYHLDVEADR
jgi:uncharacterized membrane protein (DUF485 family)